MAAGPFSVAMGLDTVATQIRHSSNMIKKMHGSNVQETRQKYMQSALYDKHQKDFAALGLTREQVGKALKGKKGAAALESLVAGRFEDDPEAARRIKEGLNYVGGAGEEELDKLIAEFAAGETEMQLACSCDSATVVKPSLRQLGRSMVYEVNSHASPIGQLKPTLVLPCDALSCKNGEAVERPDEGAHVQHGARGLEWIVRVRYADVVAHTRPPSRPAPVNLIAVHE